MNKKANKLQQILKAVGLVHEQQYRPNTRLNFKGLGSVLILSMVKLQLILERIATNKLNESYCMKAEADIYLT